MREETRCRHMCYSFRLTARVLLYAPSHRQDGTYHVLCTPFVEHWLEREIAQWVHPMKDRSDDLSHHERTLLQRSYISLPVCIDVRNIYIYSTPPPPPPPSASSPIPRMTKARCKSWTAKCYPLIAGGLASSSVSRRALPAHRLSSSNYVCSRLLGTAAES